MTTRTVRCNRNNRNIKPEVKNCLVLVIYVMLLVQLGALHHEGGGGWVCRAGRLKEAVLS